MTVTAKHSLKKALHAHLHEGYSRAITFWHLTEGDVGIDLQFGDLATTIRVAPSELRHIMDAAIPLLSYVRPRRLRLAYTTLASGSAISIEPVDDPTIHLRFPLELTVWHRWDQPLPFPMTRIMGARFVDAAYTLAPSP